MRVVRFTTFEGRQMAVEVREGATLGTAKKEVAKNAWLVAGRRRCDEGQEAGNEKYLIVEEPECPGREAERSKYEADKNGGADERAVAEATGGRIASPEEARSEEAAEVQERIRSFMNSLFAGNNDEDDEEENSAEVSPEDVANFVAIGFTENAARRALMASDGSREGAMEWLLEHANDADLDAPIPPRQAGGAGARRGVEPSPEIAARLQEMGFPAEQVADALRAANNDEERAVAILLGEGGENNAAPNNEDPQMAMLANPMLRALLTHPGILEGLRNPRVLQAFRAIVVDPGAAQNFLADPEVGPVLMQVNRVLQEGGEVDEDEE